MEWSKSVMVEVGTEDSDHQNRVDMMLSMLKQARIKDGELFTEINYEMLESIKDG